MARVALTFITLVLLTSAAASQGVALLFCEGTFYPPAGTRAGPSRSELSLAVDLVAGVVDGTLGPLPITYADAYRIDLVRPGPDGGTWRGRLDRVSGDFSFLMFAPSGEVVMSFALTCRAARPLF